MQNSSPATAPREESLPLLSSKPRERCRSLPCEGLRDLRRRWRCLIRPWRNPELRFVYHPGYSTYLSGIPFDPRKGERILAFLADEGLVDRDDLVLPRPATIRTLLRVHTANYLNSLEDPEVLSRILGVTLSNVEAEDVLSMERLMTGGTLAAARLARRTGKVVVNLGGGFHHAFRDLGMGFCVFNDIAVSIARLRASGSKARILIVDMDLHDGNGTRQIFSQDPSVHTYSIHNENWGDTKVRDSTSIALGADVHDERLLGTLLKTLPPLVEKFKPGMVFYLAGADPATDDQLGNWNLSAQGMLRRDQYIFDIFRRGPKALPMVIVLGGGYGEKSWRYTARFLAWAASGRLIEPPLTEELTISAFRRIMRDLDPSEFSSNGSPYDWSLSEEDLAGIMPGAPSHVRFLDHFSKHGVELALEKFGIFNRLRLLGYQHPVLELDLATESGESLRIFSGSDHRELLVELKVRRNRRVVPGLEVLSIEWLLLQNPRAEFGPYRRPLPGQQYPGLGMLKDMLGFLVMLGEILRIDGIHYVPSTYHVAAQSRRFVRFLRPEDEGILQALEDLLGDLPLVQASRLVDEGGILDEKNRIFQWRGVAMVLPSSQEMRQRISGPAYDEAVQSARAQKHFRLAPESGSGI